MENNQAIRLFDLSTAAFTPIVAPIACDYWIIIGNLDGSAMVRSSDPNNSRAEYTIPDGGWYSMVAGRSSKYGGSRFQKGDIVTYLKATTGVGPVVVEFDL